VEVSLLEIRVKICHITTVHRAFDTRIFYKECVSLVKGGFEVYLVTTYARDEEVNEVKIRAIPKHKNRFQRIFEKTWIAYRRALETNAEVFHFHDPELIPVGWMLKLKGKKVIYDVHENYPAEILNKDWLGPLLIRRIVAAVVGFLEALSSNVFDAIVIVVPDARTRFPKRKTVLIQNFPLVDMIDNAPLPEVEKNKLTVIYAGDLTRVRGIKECIQAMEYVGDFSELWLLGRWENDAFRKECESLKGWNHVKYLGLQPLSNTYGYMKAADIGLAVLQPVSSHLKSQPNKVFEYMACAKPVILSNFPYWQKLFSKCASFADPLDPKDVASQMKRLFSDEQLRIELGMQGRKLVEEKFSWETESKKLIAMYNNLISSRQ